mgnify:CR=1 FL=1
MQEMFLLTYHLIEDHYDYYQHMTIIDSDEKFCFRLFEDFDSANDAGYLLSVVVEIINSYNKEFDMWYEDLVRTHPGRTYKNLKEEWWVLKLKTHPKLTHMQDYVEMLSEIAPRKEGSYKDVIIPRDFNVVMFDKQGKAL